MLRNIENWRPDSWLGSTQPQRAPSSPRRVEGGPKGRMRGNHTEECQRHQDETSSNTPANPVIRNSRASTPNG